MIRDLLAAALLAAAFPAPALAQAEAWWGHVTALADDSMRGRETGSPEHRKAAEYVASVFQRAGLEPAGTEGWFQPVRFRVRRINEPRSGKSNELRQSLSVRRRRSLSLNSGPGWNSGPSVSRASTFLTNPVNSPARPFGNSPAASTCSHNSFRK